MTDPTLEEMARWTQNALDHPEVFGTYEWNCILPHLEDKADLLSRLREAEAVRQVFEPVTDSDWGRLESLINNSAHGRFWKGILRRARAAFDEKEV